MANIIMVFDAVEERRNVFLETARSQIAPMDGLAIDSWTRKNWGVVWAVAPSAPVTTMTDAGGGAIVWGDALDCSGIRQSATAVREAWRQDQTATWDGYHMAMSVGEPGATIIACDLLGVFPLYYWQGSEVVLVGTSPELFALHPLFRQRIDVHGLVGILICNGSYGGRTLLQDVRRLKPGCQLRVADGIAGEHEVYRIPQSLDYASLPLAGHVALLSDALSEATRRHLRNSDRCGVLLSGGLDSRMVAALMQRAGRTPQAFTAGVPGDLDLYCARAVARALNLRHTAAEPQPKGYPKYAELHARWEHLSNGFNTLRDWWVVSHVAGMGDHVATGLLADAIVGGTGIEWAYQDAPPSMSFEAFWKNMPALGIPLPALQRLLLPPHREYMSQVMEEIRAEYQGYSDLESFRAWRYDLAHGERFHVGSTAWRLSFGAWPVLPVLDRQVLRVASSIPPSSLAMRAAQLELVKLTLPEIAEVPLDRSDLLAETPQFILPRLRRLLVEEGRRQIGRVRRRISGRETRYWYRVNDFNGGQWREVRRMSEPFREKASEWFDRDVFGEILPAVDTPESTSVPYFPDSARKLLLGFTLWLTTHNVAG